MKLALVAADFNFDVTSLMLERARRHAEFLGAEVMIVHVPGVFDMPAIIKRLLARKDIDAVVLIGAVIKGDTLHDEVIMHATAQAVAQLAAQTGKPVGFGVTGPGMTRDQAVDRIDNARNAVESAVRMLQALKQVDSA
ncbi:MAG TPA: 6,7-dimethyl-8-ribityllumazine synthase [Candidatus Binataceae bacterium]|nr:6,7-dimethyl-8-ribityllumazine synthase [Candidatus Binataceae bacterium]